MTIGKKQLKSQLRMLLDSKPHISQEGRLLDHLQNELRLTGRASGNSIQIKPLIAECLEELALDGIVTLRKSGKVYHEVHRTARLRAIRKPASTSSSPSASQDNTPGTKEATSAESPTMPDASQEAQHAELELIESLVNDAEKFKALYETEAQALKAADDRVAQLSNELLDAQASAASSSKVLGEALDDISGLQQTVDELTKALELAKAENQQLKQRSDLDSLAERIRRLRE